MKNPRALTVHARARARLLAGGILALLAISLFASPLTASRYYSNEGSYENPYFKMSIQYEHIYNIRREKGKVKRYRYTIATFRIRMKKGVSRGGGGYIESRGKKIPAAVKKTPANRTRKMEFKHHPRKIRIVLPIRVGGKRIRYEKKFRVRLEYVKDATGEHHPFRYEIRLEEIKK